MSNLFDTRLCNDLREVVNRTDIFYRDKIQSQKFNFICAFMDRFDFAVNFLNEHTEKPKSEIEFMTYLIQASIVRDGINLCYDLLGLKEEKKNTIFKDYCIRDVGCESESDDKYYDYFRSLVFAHPLDTSWSIPNRIKDEKNYSPYCLINRHSLGHDIDSIGAMVYSNKRDNFSVTIPFEVLVNYLKYKYELLENIIEKFNDIIKEMEENWKKRKVNRNASNIDVLKDVSDILSERYLEHDYIDDFIEYLETELSESSNINNVEMFRNKIIELIPSICDAVDEYRTDDLYDICRSLLYVRPKAHSMMYYQLEKIFCYLTDDNYGDVEWGLVQADEFSKGFAKKWVNMKPREMSFKEIRLLTSVACYLEYMEQNGSDENE